MKKKFYITLFVFLLTVSSFSFADDIHYNLSAGMLGSTTMHDGTTFPIWTFREGTSPPDLVPGPTIRAKEGDRIFLHFFNTSSMPHTIHPHGLDVPQDMDGVPQTSMEIPPAGTFTYDFIAPHAGTYAYHCHVKTVQHLQMGMYGVVIVESPDGSNTVWQNGPAYDVEKIWVTGEYDSYWHTNGTDNRGGFPYYIYNPDYFIVNGKSKTDIHTDTNSAVNMDVNDTLLLRFVNIGGYLPHKVKFNGLPAKVVSSDGRPLPVQEDVSEFTIYPGERYDFIIKPDTSRDFTVDIEYLSVYDESIQGTSSVPVNVTGTIGISSTGGEIPSSYALGQNYPNPFNPVTNITFSLPTSGMVSLKVFDITGREVETIVSRNLSAGNFTAVWDASGYASGTYFYRLTAGEIQISKKMVLIK